MQTDILLKQVYSTLSELKTAIEKFEKHPSPSTQYSENLYNTLVDTTKLVSAYLVLKEQKDIAPDLDIHLKLMNVSPSKESTPPIEPIIEDKIKSTQEVIEVVEQVSLTEQVVENPIKEEVIKTETNTNEQQYPKLVININDKFRMINDLFSGNANEYHIAIEQINTVNNIDDAMLYIKGLKDIYHWKDDHEMVRRLISLTQKRFS